MTARAMRQPVPLRIASNAFLAFWCVIAAFPIFWITVMSFKSPVDAFDANPLNVIFGPATRAGGSGWSPLEIALALVVVWLTARITLRRAPALVAQYSPGGFVALGWIVAATL